jgi:hypothetical protein
VDSSSDGGDGDGRRWVVVVEKKEVMNSSGDGSYGGG